MRRFFGFVFRLFVVLALIAGGVAYYFWASFTETGPLTAEKTLVIPKGTGVSGIADLLTEQGVIENPLVFKVGVRLLSKEKPLRAGEYAFPAGVSPRAAMKILIDGKSIAHQVTIAEGLTVAEIFAVLETTPLLEGDLPALPPEGTLLPETYNYLRGENRAVLVERMRKDMETKLAELWAKRDKNVPLQSPEEALVLASIVEKETGVKAERARVAGVFYNRLKQGMPLQSDPTVIFALTQGRHRLDRPLTYADLAFDNPYNTYVNTGLPPGPIANPGLAALKAVLNPMATKELYFVADGTGGHAFAETIDEHNKNVAKWRALQKAQAN